MTIYNHVLVKCKVCGVDYCIGCFGEQCPNCDHDKLVFFSADLESRLAEVEKLANKWLVYGGHLVSAKAGEELLETLHGEDEAEG